MRVLVVSSYHAGCISTYVQEQMDALAALGVQVEYFGVRGKGIRGYLRNRRPLLAKIAEVNPNIVHAHYGLCGLLCNLQRRVPVVTTYHGSDINERYPRFFSRFSVCLSAWNMFVSQALLAKAGTPKRSSVIPCGINLSEFPVFDKNVARQLLGMDLKKRYVLFGGQMDRWVKDGPLAAATMSLVPNAEMLEFKGYSREQVPALLHAVDCLLLTSHTEGSPQVVKEAMACGCPIVSVDVGDVRERLKDIDGCYVSSSRDPQELSGLVQTVLMFPCRTAGRDALIVQQLDNRQIAKRIIDVYNHNL